MSTIVDVASHAGVSVATVSRALNNPDLVNPETLEAVKNAVKVLNYYPNRKAKSLSQNNKDLTVGVIFPDITSFYFGELYKGISKTALQNKVSILLHELETDGTHQERVMNALILLKKSGVDGVILASKYISSEYDDAIERMELPIVLVLGSHEKAFLPSYKIDNVRASFDAIAYLVSRGHKQIGMIVADTPNIAAGSRRLDGFKNAVDYYKLNVSEKQIVYGKMRYDHGYEAMKELLSHRNETKITAVFAATDEMAIGAIRCIIDAGLRVPQDISVIGYDNLEISKMSTPKLTTISQPFFEIGSEGMKHLIDFFKDPNKVKERGNHYLPYQLVERESVANISSKE